MKEIPAKIVQTFAQKHLRPYFANIFWLMSDSVLRSVIGLFILGLIARYLGPEQYGKLSFATAFVLVPSIFAGLGLREIIVRDLVKEHNKADEILATAFILKLCGGILVLFLCLGIITIVRPADIEAWWLVGILAASSIFMAFEVTDFWFQSQVKSKYTAVAKLITFFIISLLKVWLVYVKAPLVTFAWCFFIEMFLQAVAFIVAYQIYGRAIKVFQATLTTAKNLLATSWPVVLSAFALFIQSYIDQIMLGQMVGDKEVGQYSAALRIIEFFILLPSVICNSITPAITRAKMKDENLYYNHLLNNYRLMFILFLLIVTPILFFANQIISTIYGNAYQYSAPLLSLLSFRLFFANFGIARNLLFIVNENLFGYSLLTSGIGAIANILLNLILIPRYHSFGAIGASMISFALTLFIIDGFYSKTRTNLKLMLYAIITPLKLKI